MADPPFLLCRKPGTPARIFSHRCACPGAPRLRNMQPMPSRFVELHMEIIAIGLALLLGLATWGLLRLVAAVKERP
jgi:hypothetical protein